MILWWLYYDFMVILWGFYADFMLILWSFWDHFMIVLWAFGIVLASFWHHFTLFLVEQISVWKIFTLVILLITSPQVPQGNLVCQVLHFRMRTQPSTVRVSLAEVFHPWLRWEGPGSGFESSPAGDRAAASANLGSWKPQEHLDCFETCFCGNLKNMTRTYLWLFETQACCGNSKTGTQTFLQHLNFTKTTMKCPFIMVSH